MLLVSVAALSGLAKCSPTSVRSSIASCQADITSSFWKITDFEWRTGYITWSYSIGVGPAPPPPPPTQFYTCGEAMLRMNITGIGIHPGDNTRSSLAQERSIPCIEQTSDAKLANMTDMRDYNAGPWGPPPSSPHWFTCNVDSQLFIYPNGTIDPWAEMSQTGNLTTRIRMDPVKMTIEIGQSWSCDDGESGVQVDATGTANLPPLSCRGRSNLEPDANFLINSPVMHGPGLHAAVLNGSACAGPEFLVEAQISRPLKRFWD